MLMGYLPGAWPDPSGIYLTREQARGLAGWSDFALAARIASGELRAVETLLVATGHGRVRRHLYLMSDVLSISKKGRNNANDPRPH